MSLALGSYVPVSLSRSNVDNFASFIGGHSESDDVGSEYVRRAADHRASDDPDGRASRHSARRSAQRPRDVAAGLRGRPSLATALQVCRRRRREHLTLPKIDGRMGRSWDAHDGMLPLSKGMDGSHAC